MILHLPVKSKLLVVVGMLCSAFGVLAQSSTFTYQGQLSSGGSATTGLYDLRFTLHDAASLGNQVGSPVVVVPLGVTNGLFKAELTFGASVFDGSPRWLEIGVRTNGSGGAYTILTPRQLLTATPYAVRAASFSGQLASTNLTGKISDTNLSLNVALLTNSVTFSGTVTATGFVGNGSLLNNLNAANLTGTVADARLSTNVAFLNTSNTIFRGGITATNFYGYGGGMSNVPGRIFEVIPTAVNITPAFANFGYLATNDTTPVVVTLPATANIRVGETIRVSGSGAAGWIIAQNAGQKILVANLLKVAGGAWQAVPASSLQWRAAAASGDGSKLVAVVNPGLIYTSVNYGATWGNTSPSLSWTAAAASGNGNVLAAVATGGNIYTSINGGAWTARDSARNWSSIAVSTDGVRQIAGVNSGFLYLSSNSGASWGPVLTDASRSWSGVAVSGDGVNLAACAIGGNIWVSTNSGSSWTARDTIRTWSCIAAAADGGTLVAGHNGGLLYVSYDSGLSWIPTATSQPWNSVSCSADGSRMIATYGGASVGVYMSQDAGATWQLRGNLTSANFQGAAVSGDGSTAIAVGTATPIYVSSQTSTTTGTTGQLIGSRLSAVELQHVGNGVFIPISYAGNVRAK